MKENPLIIVVVGPTASGKSDFAVELAQNSNGEVISADSRQLYKGLDIGTGKIRVDEMRGIPHHMLSVYNLDEDISVARYMKDASPILLDIIARGKTPIVCGGTGQYIDSLIYTTMTPPVPPDHKLREELEKKSADELYNELLKKDSLRAIAIDRHNRVRLIRALEIVATLGMVPRQEKEELRYPTKLYLMNPTRALLRERITRRLEKRLEGGMINEVRLVMSQGYTSDTMKKFGLEYVAIGKYLEGAMSKEEMKQELITKSMQYAKRQMTWNKKYLPIAEIVDVKE